MQCSQAYVRGLIFEFIVGPQQFVGMNFSHSVDGRQTFAARQRQATFTRRSHVGAASFSFLRDRDTMSQTVSSIR